MIFFSSSVSLLLVQCGDFVNSYVFFFTFISPLLWWLREWVVYISPSTDIVLGRKPAELSSVTSQVNRRTWWRGVVNKPPHTALSVIPQWRTIPLHLTFASFRYIPLRFHLWAKTVVIIVAFFPSPPSLLPLKWLFQSVTCLLMSLCSATLTLW